MCPLVWTTRSEEIANIEPCSQWRARVACFTKMIIRTHTMCQPFRSMICLLKRTLHTYNVQREELSAVRTHTCATSKDRHKLRHMTTFAALMLLSTVVTAQDIQQVETELIAEVRVEIESGPHRGLARFVPATVLSQGEVVYYTLKIKNPTAVYMRDVSVNQRIPLNTIYVADSASGPGALVEFSVDGGVTYAPKHELTRVGPDGKQEPIDADEYTHIRWRLRNPLAPGAVALARFRAVFQ